MLLGTVKGLVSEGRIVLEAIEDHSPDIIGLHIGKEELEGLRAVVVGEIDEAPMSSYEVVYARKLSRFGEVQIPPPSLVEAYRSSIDRGIEVLSLDFDDDEHSLVYTREIDGLSMVRQSLRLKRVNRKRFDQSTVEEFCLGWDREANRLSAYRRLEMLRERKMARTIASIAKRRGRHLHVLEYERAQGIGNALLHMSTSDRPL